MVIGTGLIGGSVGLALRRAGGIRVRGYDVHPDAARAAQEHGAVDTVTSDLEQGCVDAAVIVVATPVGQIVPTLHRIAGSAGPGTFVTDTGGVKAPIVAEAERILSDDLPFVGGHPMAGTEGEGISAARADLFRDALWVLTPTPRTDPDAYRRVNALVTSTGARTLAMDAATHDRIVALVSHLPYTVATVFMDLAHRTEPDRAPRLAAGSFRDLTRTAGSNPRIWEDVLRANRSAILDTLDALMGELGGFRDALAADDWDTIRVVLGSALDARRGFPWKGERAPATPVTMEVPVPDRAGVLAELTQTLGEGGVNIEDLWMDHMPSGGVVYLVVDGLELAERAVMWLGERGFRPTILEDR